MMKKPADEILERLYKNIEPELAQFCQLMIVSPGVKPERGKPKAEVLKGVMLEFIATIYKQGVTVGYDMGHSVFAGHEDE